MVFRSKFPEYTFVIFWPVPFFTIYSDNPLCYLKASLKVCHTNCIVHHLLRDQLSQNSWNSALLPSAMGTQFCSKRGPNMNPILSEMGT